ncbi:MAG: 30S ribosomal protein S15, partial [Thermoplasmata archaeon]|nr:30S ribosomal protein S15 [Thermoplasmata archaeon]
MAKKTRGARTKLKVLKKENPAWVKMGAKDIENLVVKLSSEGLGAAMIGTKLRDSYGIPNIKLATGKSVTQILKEGGAKMDLPVDLGNLLKRVSVLQKHMAENRGDLHNKRGL